MADKFGNENVVMVSSIVLLSNPQILGIMNILGCTKCITDTDRKLYYFLNFKETK